MKTLILAGFLLLGLVGYDDYSQRLAMAKVQQQLATLTDLADRPGGITEMQQEIQSLSAERDALRERLAGMSAQPSWFQQRLNESPALLNGPGARSQ